MKDVETVEMFYYYFDCYGVQETSVQIKNFVEHRLLELNYGQVTLIDVR